MIFGRTTAAALAGLFFAATPADAAPALTSTYSSLQHCASRARLDLPGRKFETGDRVGIFACKGVGGYGVYVIEYDPRSFLALERGGVRHSLEKPLIFDFKLGYFPSVSGAQKAEWRLDPEGKPIGLIVRVAYQLPEGAGAEASALAAFDLQGAEPALLGFAKTNDAARDLVDKAWRGARPVRR